MPRLFAGLCVFLLSIAVPATLQGTRSLVVIWIFVGLSGLAAAVTSNPVRDRVGVIDRLLTHGPDLKLVVEREDWDDYEFRARILEAKIKVQNRTAKRKRLRSSSLEIPGGGNALAMQDIEFQRELERRSKMHPSLDAISVIEPRDTARGWIVRPFPWTAIPGTPEYTFAVRDELGIDYFAKGGGAKPSKVQAATPEAENEQLGWLAEAREYARSLRDDVGATSNADWFQKGESDRLLGAISHWEGESSKHLRTHFGSGADQTFMRAADGGVDNFSRHEEPATVVAYLERRIARLNEIEKAL